MSFSELFIRRPVLSTVVSLLILLLGAQGIFNMSIRQYPKVDETVITITTVYPGASSDVMQGFVTSTIASSVSAYPSVRAALLERQQEFARQPGGAVLDGRDIGTVIAPDAAVKLFVTASAEVRAHRRLKELHGRGMDAPFEDVLADALSEPRAATRRRARG